MKLQEAIDILNLAAKDAKVSHEVKVEAAEGGNGIEVVYIKDGLSFKAPYLTTEPKEGEEVDGQGILSFLLLGASEISFGAVVAGKAKLFEGQKTFEEVFKENTVVISKEEYDKLQSKCETCEKVEPVVETPVVEVVK